MAVIQRCCCCGVRAGSIVSAIYSMVIAILGLAYFGYSLLGNAKFKEWLYDIQQQDPVEFGDLDIDSLVCTVYAEYLFACIAQGLILIASIICIVGINQNNKGLLVPFMAAKSLGFVWYLFALACSGYMWATIGMAYAGETVSVFFLIPFIFFIFFISDINCLLCVLSQYQELRDGQGHLADQRQTVIIQNTMPVAAGGFAYGQMQNAPLLHGSISTALWISCILWISTALWISTGLCIDSTALWRSTDL